jgi:hypothetical protein|tara:strand:- start:405 stop:554 length:150 start_codon:yes stop_codon:yes gene_type:complete
LEDSFLENVVKSTGSETGAIMAKPLTFSRIGANRIIILLANRDGDVNFN